MTGSDQKNTLADLSAYQIYEFASYLPTRASYEGKYKRHKTRGHAKSAILNAAHQLRYHKDQTEYAEIYQWNEQEHEWVHILRYNAHDETWTEIK